MSDVSIFANVSPASFKGHFTVEQVLRTIHSTKFKTSTDYLRRLTDELAAKEYKAGKQGEQGRLVEPGHFYGVTWSGRFEGGKKAAHLQAHSRLICMDIDGLTADEVATLSGQLRLDEYTHVLFTSPSGNGVKWVVKIDVQHPDQHKAFFNQLSDYLHDSYELTRKKDVPKGVKPQIDPSGKNVDRLCFLPYDPDAYYNPDSETMPLVEEYRHPPAAAPAGERYVTEEPTKDKTRRLLNDCISQLQRERVDLADSYDAWVEIGFSLTSLGEEGRAYFHQVSRISPKYDEQQCDIKFTELLKNRNGRVNLGTFFARSEQAMGKTWEKSIPLPRSGRNGRVSLSAAPVEWEKPEPITATLLPVSPLTPDMIPEPLRDWLGDIAHRMKCPLDFVAATGVVVLSSLIGTRLTIKPKSREDWTVIPNLWGAIVGGPSSMKTPSITEVTKPLNRLVAAAREKFDGEMQTYEMASLEYEAQKKAYASQAQDRHKGKKVETVVSYPEAPKKPKERRYMVNDATVEKLADLMNENPIGLLQLRDELTGLLASWDRAGHEQDRAFHLEAWNGGGSMTIDRIGRGTTHVGVVCESLFGGIQPAKLLPYLQAATGYENDGFVQRLQLAVYPDPAPWEYVDEHPDHRARDRAFTLIQNIADADFTSIGYDADEYNRFPYTRFNADAQEVFKQWLTEWETSVLPAEGGLLLEHFTKYRSLMPSLALIFHVCEVLGEDTPATGKQLVSVGAARMAVRWCAYLISHARRIYGLLDTVSINAASELLRHLKRGDLRDGFKAREVQQKGWAGLTTRDAVESALSELVSRHWLREVLSDAPTTGRPPAAQYFVHPQILQKT